MFPNPHDPRGGGETSGFPDRRPRSRSRDRSNRPRSPERGPMRLSEAYHNAERILNERDDDLAYRRDDDDRGGGSRSRGLDRGLNRDSSAPIPVFHGDILGPPSENHALTSQEVEYCQNTQPTLVKPTFSLYPPGHNDHIQRVKPRPVGCKTIFVGGLPAMSDEQTCRELFETIGTTELVKLSVSKTPTEKITKFCHVRFVKAQSTDRAVKYNGHYMVIAKPQAQFMPHQCSQIHVDYANDHMDYQEWEQDQRTVDRYGEVIPSFSESEASRVLQYLREPYRLLNCAKVITAWCQQGQCKRMTTKTFYSLITTVNVTAKKLPYALHELRDMVRNYRSEEEFRKEELRVQCDVLQKLFDAYKQSRVYDAFTKPQRKTIDGFDQNLKKEIMEINAFLAETSGPSQFAPYMQHMQPPPPPPASAKSGTSDLDQLVIGTLREENEKLKQQLEQRGDVKKMALENANSAMLTKKFKAENEQMRKEMERLQKLEVQQHASLMSKDNEIRRLKSSLEGLEQYMKNSDRADQKHLLGSLQPITILNDVVSEEPIEEVEMECADEEEAMEAVADEVQTPVVDATKETSGKEKETAKKVPSTEADQTTAPPASTDSTASTSEPPAAKVAAESEEVAVKTEIKSEIITPEPTAATGDATAGAKRKAGEAVTTTPIAASKRAKQDNQNTLLKNELLALPLICIYLHTCPRRGSSLDHIASHLRSNGVNIPAKVADDVMRKLPALFQMKTDSHAVERWSLIVYDYFA